jgi:Flp pilus assembly protein TadG
MTRLLKRLRRDMTGRRGQRGQSLVELAIVLPLALLLMSASIDVGRILFTYIALEDAVQEGSVYLANNPTSDQLTIQGRVRGSSSAAEVEGATVRIQACPNAQLWVEADAPPMWMLTPGGKQIFGNLVLTSRINATNLKGNCT